MRIMSGWNDPYLCQLFQKQTPLIDVRSPGEFNDGKIPYSTNLPIMNDDERHQVGICYKESGQNKAIKLGHDLVSGSVKQERIKNWTEFLHRNPEAEVFCFRGGLRSQISCQWIKEAGIPKAPIQGGYKRLRNFFLSWLNEAPLPDFVRIGGLTGSGKTKVLKKLSHHIDLEEIANHRGSAFGPRGIQPTQKSFENLLALELMKLHGKKVILEDESAMLGQITVPQRFFDAMRASPLVILEVSEEKRLQNILEDFVQDSDPAFFLSGLQKIGKKLGKKKSEELKQFIEEAFLKPMSLNLHKKWILPLLYDYYDPVYQKDLRYNQDKVIFRGNEEEILAFLRQY